MWLILIWPLHAWKLSQIHFKNSSWLNNRKLVNWIGLLQFYWITEIKFESWAKHPAQSTFIDYRKVPKGVFFSEKAMCFSNLQKSIFQKTILNLKFKFPANNSKVLLAGYLNFELRIVFWNIFFLRFGDLKNESHFLKKSHF